MIKSTTPTNKVHSTMEAIQRIREIIESKLEHFSDGEYLELMNSLMSLSKEVPSAPEPADEDDLFEDQESELDEGDSDSEMDESNSDEVYVDLNALYEAPTFTPVRGQYVEAEVSTIVQHLIQVTSTSSGRELRARYSVCLYAYLFQNYSFVEDNPTLKATITERLVFFLSHQQTKQTFEHLGKLAVVEQWLQVLQS